MSERPQRPTTDDTDAWEAYWEAQDIPWRTEPEISVDRQQFLEERRRVKPEVEHSIYPFTDIKLSRADVESLLATHESGGMRGPVNLDDLTQQRRWGLDVRGADLREVDLSYLPLMRLLGGLRYREWSLAEPEARGRARARLEQADLRSAHLESANLREAYLTGADLTWAWLAGANLREANLAGANLGSASLDDKTDISGVTLAQAEHRKGKAAVTLPTSAAIVGDARWGDVDLTRAQWEPVDRLGDEQEARAPRDITGRRKPPGLRRAQFESAVRAYRQVATRLREQGITDVADRLSYRAQVCQRKLFRLRGQWGRWLGSLLLDVASGYGFRPLRSLVAYLLIVCGFASLYLLNGQFAAPHLRWDEALVLSISSFHGRGFFTSGISLGDTLARLAAAEAIIGLLIEITFIATFTQRFFAR
jgi:uncharacterized protein YjbI with pentapeptide repeats